MNQTRFRTRRVPYKAWGVLAVLVLGTLWAAAPSLAENPYGRAAEDQYGRAAEDQYGRTAVRPYHQAVHPDTSQTTRPYTVQAGDTLYRLSQRFGTTVEELVALNDIANPDLIFVGQELLVPAAGVPAGPAGGPLSLTWERTGWRTEGHDYISTLQIAAQGGQPPYTYFHDGLVQEEPTFEVAWRRGVGKPGSVGVADGTGAYVSEEYWLEDACAYPAGVEITQPSEDEELKNDPRHFNIKWVHTIDPPPDGYWIEIEVWEHGDWRPWQLYEHRRGKSELFFVPDEFPGDLGGRLRMWGTYGGCEAREKTPWRYFEFRVTD